jgi:hypothetical protein
MISLSASGSLAGSVWNFVASIYATNLPLLFIDEFSILVENPGLLDVV